MESKRRKPRRSMIIFICLAVIVSGIGGTLVWKYILNPTPAVVLPTSIENKLLFTPYLPQKLPSNLALDHSTITTHEGALFFSVENDTVTITFSEQAVPKNYDLATFYDSTIANPQRLTLKKGTAVYGDAYSNKGNIISYTTSDNTWVILSSVGPVSKTTATQLLNSLKPQE